MTNHRFALGQTVRLVRGYAFGSGSIGKIQSYKTTAI